MYKVIFVDIDGTLRNNKREISKKTKKAIQDTTKKGILVVLCSGRPRKYTENVSKECNASKYVIVSNGGAIYDYVEEKIIYENIMDKKACLELYKIAEQAGVRFVMNVGEGRVANRIKHFDGSEIQLKTDIETFVNQNNVVQCVIADEDFEKVKKLKPLIEKVQNIAIKNQHKSLINPNAPKIGTIYYDIANSEVCKGNAIKEFCKHFFIDLKDTVAIGDDYNDISMFQTVGHSVVMGNASDEVKKYANEITGSNEEDGVAMFLEKLNA